MIKKYLEISIINTLRMNFYYFGLEGLFRTYILCSRNLKIDNLKGKVILHRKERGIVRIGFGRVEVIDGHHNRAIWSNHGTISFKGDAHFSQGAKIIVKPGGRMDFGDHYLHNGDTQLICGNNIRFGDNCLVSWGGLFMDMDFHTITRKDNPDRQNKDKPIVVGNHCWIGANVVILKGCVLEDDSIISAGSVVRKEHSTPNVILINDDEVRKDVEWKY